MFGSMLTTQSVAAATGVLAILGVLAGFGLIRGDDATLPVELADDVKPSLQRPGDPDPDPDPDPVPDPEPDPGSGGIVPEPPADATVDAAFTQVVERVVLFAVDDFRDQSSSMVASASDFCGGGSTDLATLQSQWQSLQASWYYLGNYVFGPLEDNIFFPAYLFIDSYRQRGTDYTDSVRSDLAADIGGGASLDKAFYDDKNFQRVGILALEVVLFETLGNQAQDEASLAADFESTPRKCDALVGIAESLDGRVEAVEAGWVEDYVDTGQGFETIFAEPLTPLELDGSDPSNGKEPLVVLILAIQDHLVHLQDRSVVERISELAGTAWESIARSVDSAEAFLEGGPGASVSFFDVLQNQGDGNVVDTMRTNLGSIREAIELRDPVLLEVRLGELDGNFKREFPDALGVDLGTNFTDGD